MSRSSLTRGGGARGHFLLLGCVPDATFKTEIDALILAGTQVTGKFVQWTLSGNYEVTSPASAAFPNGRIKTCRYDATAATYRLTCEIWSFVDDNAALYPALCITNGTYNGTVAVGNMVECYSTTYMTWTDASADVAHAMVIALDVPASGYVDVIHG